MLNRWNDAVDLLERRLAEPGGEVDVAEAARVTLTSEHHFRRVFAALAGMPVSDYLRRRRLTLAAADLTEGRGGVLDVAVRHGWTSADAFSRAFRAHHGVLPSLVAHPGVALRAQPRLTFHLTVRGADPVSHRLEETAAFRIAAAAPACPWSTRARTPR